MRKLVFICLLAVPFLVLGGCSPGEGGSSYVDGGKKGEQVKFTDSKNEQRSGQGAESTSTE